MTTPPTVSVIIPAYQAAATVADAIDSALAQDPPPLEVIVSDDGSTDDLASALARYEGRIEVVRGPNGGLAVARNRAAAVARGDVIALLDADDVWLPGRIAAIVERFVADPSLDIVTTDAVVVRDGRPDDDTYYATRHWEEDDQLGAILRESFIFGAAAIRRAAFERVGGYEPSARAAEDWDLWLRLLASGSRAGLVRAPLYEYRRHGASLTRQRVDLALGVLATLDRASALPLSDEHRRILRRTRGGWRLKLLRAALAGRDRRLPAVARAAITDRDALEVAARRALRPLRARVQRLGERADPSRLAVRRLAADRAGSATLVAVYRARNAGVVARLLDGVPSGWEVRLWSLDDVPGELAARTVGSGPGGRFELLNRLLADAPPSEHVVLCDDDVRFVVGDLGALVSLGRELSFDVFQPSHSASSFASRSTEALVRSRRLLVGRETGFVEQGPIVVLSAAAQRELVPLPEDMGMGWGVEVRWSTVARRASLRLGIVDAVVVQHLVPPGGGYDTAGELARLRAELDAAGIDSVADLQVELARIGPLRARRARDRGSS